MLVNTGKETNYACLKYLAAAECSGEEAVCSHAPDRVALI